MNYTLSNELLTVIISDLGAEIQSVQKNGKERVWQNEDGSWQRHCPVLFPVCGKVSVKIGGVDYVMPSHGFARNEFFELQSAAEDEITFLLRENERTLCLFPFRFELRITYRLHGGAIGVETMVRNTDNKPLMFALGRHDSFLLENDLDMYKVCFEKEESFRSWRTDSSGRMLKEYDDLGGGKELLLCSDVLCGGRSIILKGINSSRVELKTVDDRFVASLDFGRIENLLLWRPGNARMICIEPWSALPDSEGENVDFPEKKRYGFLSAGEEKEFAFIIGY